MKFTQEDPGGANIVRGWEHGALRINQRTFAGAVIVSADSVAPLDLADPAELDEQALAPALALSPEVLLLGTGARQRWPAPALIKALAKRGIGLEPMDTLAAARTYNVLVGEHRRVVAVLFPHEA